MEIHQPLARLLRRGYRLFRTRRFLEAAALAASVFLATLLGALVLGLLIGGSRLGAWLVPAIVAAGLVVGLVRAGRYGLRAHVSFGGFLVRVEERAGLRRNELINALQLGKQAASIEDPFAREIAQEVLRGGTEVAKKINFGAHARARNLRGPIAQGGASLLCILLLALLAPGAVLKTAAQIVHPGQVSDVGGTQILVEPGDCIAQRGSNVPVRARIVGLAGEPVLFHRAGDGAWQSVAMAAGSAAGGEAGVSVFDATLADLQAPTEYTVAAGRMRSRTYRIDLQEPLRATGYEKRTRFPAYTGLAPEKELSPHAAIAALVGSQVELRVNMSRADAGGRLLFDSGSAVPLEAAGEAVTSAQIDVRRPETFRVELESPGVRGGHWLSEPFRVDPIPDRMPSLYLLAPGEQIDLPPDMLVVLEIDCADDFGLTRLDLVWRRNDGPLTRNAIARLAGERDARIEHPWNLDEITMVPGDQISYHLELTDNDEVSGPKTTISPEFLIRFPTVEEMYAQQTQERNQGIEDTRESLEKQVELREQLDRITRDIRQERGVQWEQKQEVEEFLQKQEQILQKMENLASGLDRQIQRMQQGQLFSPEIVAKLARIQELVHEIQSPEFRQMLERLRQAMESLNPEAVRKALEQLKFTQKDLEQGLDRTLAMLERLLAEEKLDEMIQRAERLQEQQDRINEELKHSPASQAPDSTSALSAEQAQQMRDQQEAARKELEELRKQMKELEALAARSHPQMAQMLQSPKGESSRQSLQQGADEMQSGQQCMGQCNRPGALRSGRRSSQAMRSFVQQMRQMQSQLQSSMTAELSRKLLGLASDLVALSKQQETIVSEAQRANTRELAVEQDRIGRAAGAVVDQIFDLARQTPFISPEQARILGDLVNSLSGATNAYETGERSAGSAVGRRAQTMMDMAVASLLESNQSMCNAACASSSCNKPNPFSMMQGLAGQQQGLNAQTQGMCSEMTGAARLQQDGAGRLEQLAAQQEQIRQGLEDVSQSLGGQQDILGRLDDLGREMQEVAKEIRERHLDERILRRQEKILSRLLTAQRSLRKQDFEEQRRSRTGVDPANPSAPPSVATGLSRREELRRGILKGTQDPIPSDFRRIVEAYFRALMEGQP